MKTPPQISGLLQEASFKETPKKKTSQGFFKSICFSDP